jgi:hypothetical protein
MMLNLKESEKGDLLDFKKEKNQDVDIAIDFQIYQGIKDFHQQRGEQKIVSPTDKRV